MECTFLLWCRLQTVCHGILRERPISSSRRFQADDHHVVTIQKIANSSCVDSMHKYLTTHVKIPHYIRPRACSRARKIKIHKSSLKTLWNYFKTPFVKINMSGAELSIKIYNEVGSRKKITAGPRQMR